MHIRIHAQLFPRITRHGCITQCLVLHLWPAGAFLKGNKPSNASRAEPGSEPVRKRPKASPEPAAAPSAPGTRRAHSGATADACASQVVPSAPGRSVELSMTEALVAPQRQRQRRAAAAAAAGAAAANATPTAAADMQTGRMDKSKKPFFDVKRGTC